MSKKSRINFYEDNYLNDYDFESVMVYFRHKFLKELILKYQPSVILEVGCGYDLLFELLKDKEFIKEWVIIEPSTKFCKHAKATINDSRVKIINDFFENSINSIQQYNFDFVICSSLLHEIEKVEEFLKNFYYVANKNTIFYFNVPNANSFHRQLAKEMGYIKSVFDKSDRNKILQQSHVFDRDRFRFLIEKYFDILEEGGYFIKPFTHKQMIDLKRVFNNYDDILNGLYKLGIKYPEFASEIFINCKVKYDNKKI